MNKEALIQTLKKRIKEAAYEASSDIEGEEYIELRFDAVERSKTSVKKILRLLNFVESDTFSKHEFRDIQLKEIFQTATALNMQLNNLINKKEGFNSHHKKGKTRIEFRLSSELLLAINVCEFQSYDLSWLKDFIRPHGELEEFLKFKFNTKTSIQLPSILYTSYKTKNEWLHRLKETLERNQFSTLTGKVIKKKTEDFEGHRIEFYESLPRLYPDLYQK